MRPREGDFIETENGLIFDVKGMAHPPDRVIAYLRYVPHRNGKRQRLGVKYRKVYDLSSRTRLLRTKWPQYLYRDSVFNRELQAVPITDIKTHHLPIEKLSQLRRAPQLDYLQQSAVAMASILGEEARVPITKIGISGSTLVDLHTSKSDIDLVVYGSDAARKCYSKLQALLNASSHGFSRYNRRDLDRLYVARKQGASMSFESFSQHERSKRLQGKFNGIDYYIRCVRDWDEWKEGYGSRRYFPAGRSTVQATVSDDKESIFTPSKYRLANTLTNGKFPAPSEIVSFRGRFCEQVHSGERIRAEGTLERVTNQEDEFRLVLGENPGDYLKAVRSAGK
jgi:predicted nucleotidyltransferase